jgi:hypothetical protein
LKKIKDHPIDSEYLEKDVEELKKAGKAADEYGKKLEGTYKAAKNSGSSGK